MNRRGTVYQKTNANILLLVVLFIISGESSAEVRSGFWTRTIPSERRQNYEVDFSELASICYGEFTENHACSLFVTDCMFSQDNRGITASKGILFDSTLDAEVQALIKGKQMEPDWNALFYLDSMMKKMELVAPENGYRDSIAVQKESFFIKTDEDNYVFMMKVDEYIGGLDRSTYYWIYNSDNGRNLYKNNLIAVPSTMSLSIAVDCFSGRPNPEFVVSDSVAVTQLVHAMYRSVNTLLDPTIARENTLSCPAELGYRSLQISGRIVPFSRWESYIFMFELCEGRLTMVMDPVTSVEPLRQYYIDPDSRLEKEIIRLGCAFDLMSTEDTYPEPVSFCGVVPDSLKTDTRISEKRREPKRIADQLRIRIAGDNKIRIPNNGADVIQVDAINLQGKCFTLVKGHTAKGPFEADLNDYTLTAGFYLLNIRVGSRVEVVPVIVP